MRFVKSIMTVTSIAILLASAGNLDAQASEWGCQVLLCASSTNPSWRGVPACNPPMGRLIAAMSNWDFSWPTCPEAGTGNPGYRKYADCPDGWSIGYSNAGHESRSEPDRCVKRAACIRSHGCIETKTMARPTRESPYYFDIPADAAQTTRHWFSLR